MSLPPGQHRVDGFPRFGAHLHRPAPPVPADPGIAIRGADVEPFTVDSADFATLPRRAQTADFHCVAGWSATGLRWEGVAFATFYETVIAPALPPGTVVTHVAFRGLDGYRSVAVLEDALAGDVLIADRLGGRPLGPDHGAPLRLVSPSQYGFMSTKHLCAIELRTRAPHPRSRAPLIKEHPRARVWHEERHPDLPARLLRPVYRLLVAPIAFLSARGRRD